MNPHGLAALVLLLGVGCARREDAHPPLVVPTAGDKGEPRAASEPSLAPAAPAAPLGASAELPPVKARYGWGPKASSERLDQRFPAPAGFSRVAVPAGSFGEFLRTLPLSPVGTKVVSYKGDPLYTDGTHPGIVAVVDIDIGDKDLQQCADAIIRMHAEWKYGTGSRDIAYRAVSSTNMPYASYLQGSRPVAEGNQLTWVATAKPQKDDHGVFRRYLDDVFAWAGTASLVRDATKTTLADLTPGDFFVLRGNPFGHGVLVLDLAKDAKGNLARLLGQSYMPAQSFSVLTPAGTSGGAVWFRLDATSTEIKTPFWIPFPMTSLRRLP